MVVVVVVVVVVVMSVGFDKKTNTAGSVGILSLHNPVFLVAGVFFVCIVLDLFGGLEKN